MEKFGTYSYNEKTVSYQIIDAASQQEIDEERKNYATPAWPEEVIKIEEYSVAVWGMYNWLPTEVKELIKNNHLLPEILKKQVRYLYGDGPTLFKTKSKGDGTEKTKTREYLSREEFADVFSWLESWEENGMPDNFNTYLKKVATEYYYMESYFSKWHFNRSRRIGGAMPVRGLEHLNSDRCRLGKFGEYDLNYPLEDEEMKFVLYGRWDLPLAMSKRIYPRLDRTNLLRHPEAVNYVKDHSFADEIYTIPTFYYGLKEWIKGSNINAKYVNSYLKNSLNAKLHVIIPNAWLDLKEKTLKGICERNQQLQREGKTIATEFEGLTKIGTTFNYGLLDQLVKLKLREVTEVMTGEGENQGKFFTSRSFQTERGIEQWEFKEIPTKYKEFVDSIIAYDKRGVEVILQGKGIPPSISNVSKDGVFSSSGSDTYYNYLIYLNSLVYAEEFITEDINRALHLNFPRLRAQNIKLGFDRNVPARQEELGPKQRLENTK